MKVLLHLGKNPDKSLFRIYVRFIDTSKAQSDEIRHTVSNYKYLANWSCNLPSMAKKCQTLRDYFVNYLVLFKTYLISSRFCIMEFRMISAAAEMGELPCLILQIKFLTQYCYLLWYRNPEEHHRIFLVKVCVPETGTVFSQCCDRKWRQVYLSGQRFIISVQRT